MSSPLESVDVRDGNLRVEAVDVVPWLKVLIVVESVGLLVAFGDLVLS